MTTAIRIAALVLTAAGAAATVGKRSDGRRAVPLWAGVAVLLFGVCLGMWAPATAGVASAVQGAPTERIASAAQASPTPAPLPESTTKEGRAAASFDAPVGVLPTECDGVIRDNPSYDPTAAVLDRWVSDADDKEGGQAEEAGGSVSSGTVKVELGPQYFDLPEVIETGIGEYTYRSGAGDAPVFECGEAQVCYTDSGIEVGDAADAEEWLAHFERASYTTTDAIAINGTKAYVAMLATPRGKEYAFLEDVGAQRYLRVWATGVPSTTSDADAIGALAVVVRQHSKAAQEEVE